MHVYDRHIWNTLVRCKVLVLVIVKNTHRDIGPSNEAPAKSMNIKPRQIGANRARSGAQNLWDTPDFSGVHILPCKKKKNIRSTSFQVKKGKTIKKLQLIPNTIMNTNVLECFDDRRQICFIYPWIGKHLVNCLR